MRRRKAEQEGRTEEKEDKETRKEEGGKRSRKRRDLNPAIQEKDEGGTQGAGCFCGGWLAWKWGVCQRSKLAATA
jgi:hypothetical protein